jgi:hypothetical protein
MGFLCHFDATRQFPMQSSKFKGTYTVPRDCKKLTTGGRRYSYHHILSQIYSTDAVDENTQTECEPTGRGSYPPPLCGTPGGGKYCSCQKFSSCLRGEVYRAETHRQVSSPTSLWDPRGRRCLSSAKYSPAVCVERQTEMRPNGRHLRHQGAKVSLSK